MGRRVPCQLAPIPTCAAFFHHTTLDPAWRSSAPANVQRCGMGLGCWHSSVDRYVQLSKAVLGIMGQLALHRVGSMCADTGGANTGGGKKAESGMMPRRYWNTSVPTARTAACSLVSVLGICPTLAAVDLAAPLRNGALSLV